MILSDRERIEELEEENSRLEGILEALKGSSYWPRDWKLDPTGVKILNLLVLNGFVSHSAIYDALYWHKLDPPLPDTIKVFVSRLRARLPADVIITCRWGRGYELDDASLDRAKSYRIGGDA